MAAPISPPPETLATAGLSELSHAILTEVLRTAVTGYRDIVTENFAAFGWALGLNSALPVQVEGTLVIPEDDNFGDHTKLHYELKPARAASRDTVLGRPSGFADQPGTGGMGHGSSPGRMTGSGPRSTFRSLRDRPSHRAIQTCNKPRIPMARRRPARNRLAHPARRVLRLTAHTRDIEWTASPGASAR